MNRNPKNPIRTPTGTRTPRPSPSSCFACCKELWLLRFSSFRRKLVVVSASLGVLLLESLVLCSRGGTRVQPLNLCFHQPVLHLCFIYRFFTSVRILRVWRDSFLRQQRLEWTSLLAMAGLGLADPASPVVLSMSPSGWSAVPQTVLQLRFSIGPSDFDAGSSFKIFSLVSCLLNGCLKTC